ncbi:spermatogenesis-associated serine-rich protein 1 [Hemicordylus capensis]|uniref:spermatogenesis-associated serine-rich protein 1 n=1 Tax=Hemicordylus capensis TaxID=884348 RepID=UPI0023040BA7|nr:spermatogenesis-associated serine-rich protein 1 [Hemicordylus capensis]
MGSILKAEESSVSPFMSSEDNETGSPSKVPPCVLEQNNCTTDSNALQEQGSTFESLQHNDNKNPPDTPSKLSKKSDPSEQDSHLKSSSSASLHHSNAPLSETKLVKETDKLINIRMLKSSPRTNDYSDIEWTFYPGSGNCIYHTGKKCIFDGVHLRTRTTASERTLEMCTGKKKYATEIDSRNGIPLVTPGDHPYACPEQSTDFYKLGSAMAPVNFGSAVYKKKTDTFIPLQRLPGVPSVPFRLKEKQQELEREKMEVKNLDLWKPSPSLLQSLLATGLARKLTLQQL